MLIACVLFKKEKSKDCMVIYRRNCKLRRNRWVSYSAPLVRPQCLYSCYSFVIPMQKSAELAQAAVHMQCHGY